jgi:hypothetical protein
MSGHPIAEIGIPKTFRTGQGPDWTTYVQDLRLLDSIWRDRTHRGTSFGVIGRRPSWEDTIARGRALFELESWAQLNEEHSSLIAPAHSFTDGDALLGSVGRRSKEVRSFLSDPAASGDRDHVLSLLKHARALSSNMIPVLGGDILAEMCAVRGMGRSFATRLLALARPDAFVVVNQNQLIGCVKQRA